MSKPGLTDEDMAKLRDMATNGVRKYAKTGGGRPDDEPEPDTEPQPRRFRLAGGDVTPALCQHWRDCSEDHTYDDLADEFNTTKNTVWRHVNGKCTHRYARIDAERCGVIRCMASDGHSFSHIARTFPEFGARRNIRDHAVGECSCEVSIPPVKPRREANGVAHV